MTVTIILNGEKREIEGEVTIAALLEELHISGDDGVALEVNEELVEAEDYGRRLAADDRVEILRFVGGG